ncbi:MAG: hypothetical protein AVDCRST_MAG85-2098, partial [uncultured Solirubrobacteraceae bacterium]
MTYSLVARDPATNELGVAVHSGEGCMLSAGHVAGDGWSVQANIMASDAVWPAMAEAFAAADPGRPLAERLVMAMEAAQAAGGDVRGMQSAALLVVPGSGEPWRRSVDLRVEDHPDPLTEMRRLVTLNAAYSDAGAADELMADGASPPAALDQVLEGDEARSYRQTALVDVRGRVAVFTGE